MSKKQFTVVLIAAVAVLIVGLAAFFLESASMKENSALGSFLLLEEEDPLFDIPGATPAELRDITAIIEKAGERTKTSLEEVGVNRQLYPIHFWESLAAVAEAREHFIENSTRWRGLILVLRQYQTLASYRRDLEEFSLLWQEAADETKNGLSPGVSFIFLPGVSTNFAIINSALALHQKNIETLKNEFAERAKCLFFGQCPLPREARQKNLSGEQTLDNKTLSLLPLSHLENSRRYLNAVTREPSVYLVETSCFGEKNSAALLAWERRYQNIPPSLLPKLATNSYFRFFGEHKPLPSDRLVYDAGLAFVWQLESNWYMCPDLEYYPEFATLLLFKEAVLREPFSNRLDAASFAVSPETITKLREAEDRLREAHFVDASLVGEYLRTLRALRLEIGKEDPVKSKASGGVNKQNKQLQAELEKQERIWETRTGNFSSVMRRLDPESATFITLATSTATTSRLVSVTLTRSYFSLLFGSWNSSIWRLAERPSFTANAEVSLKHQSLAGFWELEKQYGDAYIESAQMLSIEGLDKLFKK
mgnify:CR=1 FL=1